MTFSSNTKVEMKDLNEIGDSNPTFNQFEGKTSTYDEKLYTSTLDQSKITQKQRQEGLKIEQEINKQQSDNKHMAMERGQLSLNDEYDERQGRNEEMMYSGVIRKHKFKKFTNYKPECQTKAIDQMQHKFIEEIKTRQ